MARALSYFLVEIRHWWYNNAIHFTDHGFSLSYKLFNTSTLECARDRADVIFAFKILSNFIDCSDLLMKFNFYIPQRRLRANNYFFNPILQDGEKKNIVHRFSELCNNNAHWLDLYCSSLYQVQKKSKNLLKFEWISIENSYLVILIYISFLY